MYEVEFVQDGRNSDYDTVQTDDLETAEMVAEMWSKAAPGRQGNVFSTEGGGMILEKSFMPCVTPDPERRRPPVFDR